MEGETEVNLNGEDIPDDEVEVVSVGLSRVRRGAGSRKFGDKFCLEKSDKKPPKVEGLLICAPFNRRDS